MLLRALRYFVFFVGWQNCPLGDSHIGLLRFFEICKYMTQMLKEVDRKRWIVV